MNREIPGRTYIKIVSHLLSSDLKLASDLKAWLKHNFPNPGKRILPEISKHTPPIKAYKRYPSDIGYAYECLFRLLLLINYDKHQAEEQLQAMSISAKTTSMNLMGSYLPPNIEFIIKGRNDPVIRKYKPIIYGYSSHLRKAVNSGEISDDLIYCICVSKWLGSHDFIEHDDHSPKQLSFVKKHKSLEFFDEPTYLDKFEGYYNEVSSMIRNTNIKQFKPIRSIVLKGSIGGIINGAYDIIIDDCIIDIKTNIDYALKRRDLNQVLIYLFLGKIYGMNKEPYQLNKIGLYLARYDYLWTFDLRTLGQQKQEDLISEFKEFLIGFGKLSDIIKPERGVIKAIKLAGGDVEELKARYIRRSYFPRTRKEIEADFIN